MAMGVIAIVGRGSVPVPLFCRSQCDSSAHYILLSLWVSGLRHVFPLQLAILLSDAGADFSGGEFVMTEQRPRMQSRPMVVPLRQGDGIVFAVHNRPVRGTRSTYRVNLRHGVSRIRSGHRYTVGIIFHDAT